MSRRFFSSESVTEGHPDKVCDRVSDAVLDAILAQDPMARVACETAASTGFVHVMGEITTTADVNIEKVAREAVIDAGYDRPEYGFDGNSCAVLVSVHGQSPDISQGVDTSLETRTGNAADDGLNQGAGDQGMMIGFACNETPELMPMPIVLAQKLTKKLSQVRREGVLDYLRPDGKSQVTVEYDNDNKPIRVDTVLIATQHAPTVHQERIARDVIREVILPTIPAHLIDADTKFLVNTTGRFVVGGPVGDCGLTGRKIIVDTYGGWAPHGGGAFSGKDPSKVDRTGCYAVRHAAKNIVAAGLADRCAIEVAYAIGVAQPISIYVDTCHTGKVPDDVLEQMLRDCYDFRPGAIIKRFDMRRPIYRQISAFGHFGRCDLDLPWERTELVDTFRKYLNM